MPCLCSYVFPSVIIQCVDVIMLAQVLAESHDYLQHLVTVHNVCQIPVHI